MSKSKVEEPFSTTIARNLADKLYEKRKAAALEIEKLVKDYRAKKSFEEIGNIIDYLSQNFIETTSVHTKKGGLIALAAVALGLGFNDLHTFIRPLVYPVLNCFSDPDNKVRYYACESLYNISKISKSHVLFLFNDIFTGICKLASDTDANVRNGVELLDRLIKYIVTEGHAFNLESFIPELCKQLEELTDPESRKVMVSWLFVLDSVPSIDLLSHLPQFLGSLFKMLSDPREEIRVLVKKCLSEFLQKIKSFARSVDYGSLIPILSKNADSTDELTCLTAVGWVTEFIIIGKEQIMPYGAQLLTAILPCISRASPIIEEASKQANKHLLDLVRNSSQELSVKEFLDTLLSRFANQYVPTQLAALRWILLLHLKNKEELSQHMEELFHPLLMTLSDQAEEVVRLDLQVLAKLSSDDTYFEKFMKDLINLFSTDRKLLENRGNLIVRQLCLYIKPEQIYRSLANILDKEEDPEFARTMVQTLNLILLTSTELFEVRNSLQNLSTPESKDLFSVLYRSWCHSPAAVFSLCLLAQVYEHASDLVFKFAEIEVSVAFLLEIDKLVQLLESPIFIYLRIQLLEPEKYPYLFKSLYGILMLLPQTSAFETLKSRLTSVTDLGVLQLIPRSEEDASSGQHSDIDFDALLDRFLQVTKRHSDHQSKKVSQRAPLMSNVRSATFNAFKQREPKDIKVNPTISKVASFPAKLSKIVSSRNTNNSEQ